ncbi:MAG: hypothetical protein RBU30_14835 [Polyangia bacterium]|jgi:hypothetical protein|nr:hypothetical protein [Polyangia bacterium]
MTQLLNKGTDRATVPRDGSPLGIRRAKLERIIFQLDKKIQDASIVHNEGFRKRMTATEIAIKEGLMAEAGKLKAECQQMLAQTVEAQKSSALALAGRAARLAQRDDLTDQQRGQVLVALQAGIDAAK